jgi:hypothetical protein
MRQMRVWLRERLPWVFHGMALTCARGGHIDETTSGSI